MGPEEVGTNQVNDHVRLFDYEYSDSIYDRIVTGKAVAVIEALNGTSLADINNTKYQVKIYDRADWTDPLDPTGSTSANPISTYKFEEQAAETIDGTPYAAGLKLTQTIRGKVVITTAAQTTDGRTFHVDRGSTSYVEISTEQESSLRTVIRKRKQDGVWISSVQDEIEEIAGTAFGEVVTSSAVDPTPMRMGTPSAEIP